MGDIFFWEGCGCYHGQWDSVVADTNSPSLLHLWMCPLLLEISSVERLMYECRYELNLHGMYCQRAWESYSHPWLPRGWTWVEVCFLSCKDKEGTRSASPMSRCVQGHGWQSGQQIRESQDSSHRHCWVDLPDRIGEVPAREHLKSHQKTFRSYRMIMIQSFQESIKTEMGRHTP